MSTREIVVFDEAEVVDAPEFTDATFQQSQFDVRLLRGGRNDGPGPALASHVRAIEVLPPKGCQRLPDETTGADHSPGFVVHDAGDLHRKTLQLVERGRGPFTDERAEHIELVKNVLADEIQASADVVDAIRSQYGDEPRRTAPGQLKPPPSWGQADWPTYTTFQHDGYKGPKSKIEQFKPAERPTKEQMREWDERLGIPREPAGCKFKRDNAKYYVGNCDPKPNFGFNPNSPDDEWVGKRREYDYVFDASPQTHNSVEPSDVRAWAKVKAASGKYGVGVDEECQSFRCDAYIMEFLLGNPTKDPQDGDRWIKDHAEALGITVEAFRKRITRAQQEIERMKKARATYRAREDDGETGERYISVKLNMWGSYKLDIERWGTEEAAIRAVKAEKIVEATRKKITGDPAHDTPIILAATERIERAFLPANRRITRLPAWMGILGQLFEQAHHE